MKRSQLRVFPGIVLVLFITAFAGCNVFEFGNDAEKSSIEKAEDKIADGNYADAKEELADQIATTDDPVVLYTYAKASILEAGIDVATIIDLVEGDGYMTDGENLPLLEEIAALPISEQNTWYTANKDAAAALERIWHDEVTGVLEKDDIAFDYSIALVMKAILGLRDTNQDGVIDLQQDPPLDLISMNSGSGFVLGKNVTVDGQTVNTGLTSFLGNWSPTGKRAAGSDYTYSPDDINVLIAYILTMLEQGEESIQYLIDLYNESDTETSIDYEDIQEYIYDVVRYLNYYWYNDNIDNDGDGRIDEETIDGIDNDNDGFIDEDSDYHSSDQSNTINDEYIALFEYWYERLGLNQ